MYIALGWKWMQTKQRYLCKLFLDLKQQKSLLIKGTCLWKLSMTFNTLAALSHKLENAKETLTTASNLFNGPLEDSAKSSTNIDSPFEQNFCTFFIFTLVYAYETFTLYQEDLEKLEWFQKSQAPADLHQIAEPMYQQQILDHSEKSSFESTILRTCHLTGLFKTHTSHPLQW